MPEQATGQKMLKGSAFLMTARLVDRSLGFVSITILARLLTPADFGIVAIAATVVSAVELFTQFGFDWALVRYPDLSPDDLNAAWTLRVLLGLGVFCTLSVAAPWVAVFYHQKPLSRILVVLGFASLIEALQNIGTVYFRRTFAFNKEFQLQSIGKLVGFLTSMGVAITLRSYWALVFGNLAATTATSLVSYLIHPYRPRPGLRRAGHLFRFSSWLLIGNIAEYCRERFSDLYLGRVFGASVTGLFSVAGDLSIVPLSEIAAPTNRVAFSKYTEDVRESRSLKASYLSIASLIWMAALPIAAGTIAIAPEIVALILGPRWAGATPVLRLLALGISFTVMVANTHYVYWALGHSRVVATLSVISAAMIVPMTFIAAHYEGYVGVAWAFTIQSALTVPINFILLRRLAGIAFIELWRRVWRIAFSAALMPIVLMMLFRGETSHNLQNTLRVLVAEIATGAAIYIAVVMGLWYLAGRPVGPEDDAMRFATTQLTKRIHP